VAAHGDGRSVLGPVRFRIDFASVAENRIAERKSADRAIEEVAKITSPSTVRSSPTISPPTPARSVTLSNLTSMFCILQLPRRRTLVLSKLSGRPM